jgi:VanZ family protein
MLMGLPGKDVPDMSFWSLLTPDKIFHSGIFLVLVVLLIVGFTKQHSYIRLYYHAKSFALMFGVLFGGITELLQMFVFTDRTADIMDFVANAIGCVLGLLVFRVIFGKKK